MKTPSTSTVTSTVAMAAKLGTGLRRSERSASRRKKPGRISGSPDGSLLGAAHARGELAGGLLARVAPGRLVADDAPAGQLDDAPAHPVDHLHVVGGDQDGRARA